MYQALLRLIGAEDSKVYLALWNGEKVVVKVLVGCKNLDWFESDIRAYEHLNDARGRVGTGALFHC